MSNTEPAKFEPKTPVRSVSRLASFGHAIRGLKLLMRQPNARIHVAVAVLVLILGYTLGISSGQWYAVTLSVALVIGAEALNTAIEFTVDLISPEWHPLVRDAKDVAAAGVLVCSIGAALVGLGVFVPKILALLSWGV
jgi:diacylglycerol kinase